jgi:hypothetical protein
MPLIRCTHKLLKEMGLKPNPVTVGNPAQGRPLGDWYANLLRIERRKCLLMMNSQTLFSFLLVGVSRDSLRDLPALFCSELRKILEYEGAGSSYIDLALDEYQSVGIATTADRGLLGSMNDLAYHYKAGIDYSGGLGKCNLPEEMRQVNRMPQRTIGWKYSIEALNEAIGTVLPHDGLTDPQRELLNQLEEMLTDRGAEAEVTYSEVVNAFGALPAFMQACYSRGLECFIPMGTVPEGEPWRFYIRRPNLATRMGMGRHDVN